LSICLQPSKILPIKKPGLCDQALFMIKRKRQALSMEEIVKLIRVFYLDQSEIGNIVYILNGSKTVNSVKLILGLSKCQI